MKIAIFGDEISLDFDTAVELGTTWGIRHFEIRSFSSGRVPRASDTDIQRALKVKERYGISISAISPGLFKIPVESDEVETGIAEALPKTFDIANQFDTSNVVIFAFHKGGGERCQTDECPAEVIDRIGEMAAKAELADMMLHLENEPICWGDTGLRTAEIIRKVNSPNLRLNWDPANSFASGGVPYPDEYEQIKDLVGHLHIKDIKKSETGRRVVPPGQGDIDWHGQLKALHENAYDGFYTIETHFGPKVQASRSCFEGLSRVLLEAL